MFMIAKEFDTFYIYSTIYFGANEGETDTGVIISWHAEGPKV